MWNPLRAREGEPSPHARQVIVLIFGGFALAFGGCAGFASTVMLRSSVAQTIAIVMAVLFGIGALSVIGGVGWFLVLIFKRD